jgi:hypothetical protein
MIFTLLETLLAMFIFGLLAGVFGFLSGTSWAARNQTLLYRGLRKKILGDLAKKQDNDDNDISTWGR